MRYSDAGVQFYLLRRSKKPASLMQSLLLRSAFVDLYMAFQSASRINVRHFLCNPTRIDILSSFAVEIAGYDASIGYTQWANKLCTSDAKLVREFRDAGAIIIAKTNVPQTMLSFECSNPLFGRSTNPWSSNFTCGGSSGGEAALLASGGSALGVGSDIGGSLRIPAGYCGIYSLKPGQGRLSKDGARCEFIAV